MNISCNVAVLCNGQGMFSRSETGARAPEHHFIWQRLVLRVLLITTEHLNPFLVFFPLFMRRNGGRRQDTAASVFHLISCNSLVCKAPFYRCFPACQWPLNERSTVSLCCTLFFCFVFFKVYAETHTSGNETFVMSLLSHWYPAWWRQPLVFASY